MFVVGISNHTAAGIGWDFQECQPGEENNLQHIPLDRDKDICLASSSMKLAKWKAQGEILSQLKLMGFWFKWTQAFIS